MAGVIALLREATMSTRHIPTVLFAALLIFFMSEVVVLWPSLPERVATHFNTSGVPNGWSSRSGLVRVLGLPVALFTALFVAAGWLDRIPARFMNLPRREYWLAPERREATYAALRDGLRWFLLVTFATLGFVLLAGLRANLTAPPHLALNPLLPLAGFVAAAVGLAVWLRSRFRAR
jgi:uncharacterized membrane protein